MDIRTNVIAANVNQSSYLRACISSQDSNRMTPKSSAPVDADAAKKRKWSVGSSTHVTPIPDPIAQSGGASQKKKKNRKTSSSQEDGTTTLDEIFPKLDTSDPESARRLQQRRRAVAFGKNTVGYDNYRKQVPVSQRKSRSMEHPNTPDHTLDIPNRRWLGLVKAWRIALHQFDPPEMKQQHTTEDVSENAMLVESPMAAVTVVTAEKKSTQEQEMERAKHQGLPVDFNTGRVRPSVVPEKNVPIRRVLFVQDDDDDDDDDDEEKEEVDSLIPVHSSSNPTRTRQYYWPYGKSGDTKKFTSQDDDELDRWEKQNAGDDLLVDYEDSDDDLL